MKRPMVLSIGNDAKTVKGEKIGYMTGVMYLAPGNLSGRELCANRTPGCSVGCIYFAGKGRMTVVQKSRLARTARFLADQQSFLWDIAASIRILLRRADAAGLVPLVRLNGTSDIPWENVRFTYGSTLFEIFPGVQFYDYTKNPARMRRFLSADKLLSQWPLNYHLTFSRSECNEADTVGVLASGGNVAVVFDTPKGKALPTTWRGFTVIDGDTSDVRHKSKGNGKGKVIGLRAKGPARHDTTGFVIKVGG